MGRVRQGHRMGKNITKKICAIISAINTQAYQSLFGVSTITVAIGTTEGEKRRDTMRSFVSQELHHTGLLHLANVVLFAALPQDLDPHTLFLSSIWYTPGNPEP